jgi:hypothetical protein
MMVEVFVGGGGGELEDRVLVPVHRHMIYFGVFPVELTDLVFLLDR